MVRSRYWVYGSINRRWRHWYDVDFLTTRVIPVDSLDLSASETSPNTFLRHGHSSGCFGSLTNKIECPWWRWFLLQLCGIFFTLFHFRCLSKVKSEYTERQVSIDNIERRCDVEISLLLSSRECYFATIPNRRLRCTTVHWHVWQVLSFHHTGVARITSWRIFLCPWHYHERKWLPFNVIPDWACFILINRFHHH